MDWYLKPGDRLRRKDLHDDFGGGRQGGIAPSRQTDNLLIFSDPKVGEQHGYMDHWEDGEYHYAGEGQAGDQTFDRGNGAILHHRRDGRALRVFWGVRGEVEYAGEFELAADQPTYTIQAKETNSERLRRVIMFRLLPIGAVTTPDERRPTRKLVQPGDTSGSSGGDRPGPSVSNSPLSTSYRDASETTATAPRDPFAVDPNIVDRGLIGHATTQNGLAAVVRAAGCVPLSPGAGDPDFDLAWHEDVGLVVAEIKSPTATNETGQLRLGLGQVLDYQDRLAAAGRTVRSVLAVEKAPADSRWSDLCRHHGVTLVWPETFHQALGERARGERTSSPRPQVDPAMTKPPVTSIVCPACGVRNRLPEGHGNRVRCGNCKTEMQISR